MRGAEIAMTPEITRADDIEVAPPYRAMIRAASEEPKP